MRPGLYWLASFLVFPLVGSLVSFARPYRALPLSSRLALGAGVGAFILSTLMTIFSLAGVRWSVPSLIGGAVLVCAAIGRRLSRDSGGEDRGVSAAPGAYRVVGALLMAATVANATLATVAGGATSADLITFWGPKAQAFAAARTIDAAFLSDPLLGYLHPSYPPLVTNVFAFASLVAGRFAWGAATATFPLLLAALAVGLWGLLRRSMSAASASTVSALVVCGLGLVGTEVNIAGNGEMPLLFYETLAMALLVGADATNPSTQLLAGLLLGGAASAKIEGLPFVLAAAGLFVWSRSQSGQRWRVCVRLLGPTTVAIGAWLAYGALKGVFRGYDGYGSLLKLYPEALPTITESVAYSLWLIAYGMPFLFPLVYLALRPRPWRPALLPIGVAVTLACFYVFTYLHVPDPAEWISWSAARIFSPLIPLLALAGGIGSRDPGRFEGSSEVEGHG